MTRLETLYESCTPKVVQTEIVQTEIVQTKVV